MGYSQVAGRGTTVTARVDSLYIWLKVSGYLGSGNILGNVKHFYFKQK